MIVETYIMNRDWDGLSHHLGSVSNAEFRRLQTVMREKVMPHLANEAFWATYLHLLMFRRQAFLPCVLAAEGLAKSESLDFDCQEAREVAAWMQANSPDSVVKVVRMMVPILTSAQQIEGLFRLFEWDNERECALVLIKESTPWAYYVLFNVLRRAADNRQLLVAACQAIMRKNDDMSFNMASLLRSYFDLNEIKSTFSLQIEPYELSYIEQSYDNFLHVLKGKRPRI